VEYPFVRVAPHEDYVADGGRKGEINLTPLWYVHYLLTDFLYVLSQHFYGTGVVINQAQNRFQKCRLARAVWPQNTVPVPLFDLQEYVGQYTLTVVSYRKVFY